MDFTEAVKTVLTQKYATFSGRASRSEFWWFQLFVILFWTGLGLLFAVPLSLAAAGGFGSFLAMVFGLVAVVAVFGLVIPSIALTVRRFHDHNASGWWVLLFYVAGVIPYVGFLSSLVLLVIMAVKGTEGPNRFGPDPLRPDSTDWQAA